MTTTMQKSVATSPQAGDVHVNTPLSNFATKFLQDTDAFVALRAMPGLPVAKQSDLYWEFNPDDFRRDQAKRRADGTESAGADFRLSTSPYFADVDALHKDVSDRQRANQDEGIQLDRTSTEFLMQLMLIRREKLWRDAFFGTGLWDTDVVGTTDFVKWDAASSDPILNIRVGKRVVQGKTGFRPNKLVIGRAPYDAILDNDAVLDRISGGATTALPAMVMRQRLAELLELDVIHVMDAIETTTAKGAATEAQAFIGGDNALLYYAPDALAFGSPTAGATFNWTGFVGADANGSRVKRFRMEALASDRIEAEMAFDHKLVGSSLGYFFSDCTAA